MVHLRWLEKGVIARSSIPHHKTDIDYVYEQGVRAIVSAENVSLEVLEEIEKLKIKHLLLEIPDFDAPSKRQIEDFFKFLDKCILEKMPCLVHCYAGKGRTGTLLALYLIRKGLGAEYALYLIGGVESPTQRQCITDFSENLRTIKPV